jgi:sec-independent protein translocase protein TatA
MSSFILFLNISGGEILVILVVVYLVFGPKKIPELARMLGKGINELRRATNEIKNEITKETSGIKKDIGMADIDLNDPLDLNKTPKKNKPAGSANKTDSKPEPATSEKTEEKPEPIVGATKRKTVDRNNAVTDPDPYNLREQEPIDR